MLSDVIKQALMQQRKTVYRLSKDSGVSWGHLKSIIDGAHSPSLDILQKITAALGLTIEYVPSEQTSLN